MSGGWKTGGRDPRYNTPAWKRARAAALKRADRRCELRLDGCQGTATEVDHVLGLDNDPGHTTLRAVCGRCHRKRTSEQGNSARRRDGTRGDPDPKPRTRWLPQRRYAQ